MIMGNLINKMMRKSSSYASIREVFTPPVDENLESFESDLTKIREDILRKDRRHLGSLLGALAFSLIGIAISPSTVFGFVIGSILGFLLGHILGRKWITRFPLQSLPPLQNYAIRMTCLIIYLRSLTKREASSALKISMIEKVVNEFRPALMLQFQDSQVMKQVQFLTKTLRKGYFHLLLLNGLSEIQSLMEQNIFPATCANRFQNSYIPAFYCLKKSGRRQLEFVLRMQILISDKKITDLLNKFTDNSIISMLIPSPSLAMAESKKIYGQSSQFIDVNNYFSCKVQGISFEAPYKNKVDTELFHRRRLSELINPPLETYRTKSRLKLLQALAPYTSHEPMQEEELSSHRLQSLVSYQESEIVKYLIPQEEAIEYIIIDGDNGDIEASSDFSSSEELITPNLVPYPHPFENDFLILLDIEAEGNDQAKWKLTVNKPDTKIYQRKTGESPICMIKAYCELEFSAETVFTALWDEDVRKQWDILFKEFKIIDTQEDYDVLYYSIKTPFGISRRDWLQRRTFIRDFPQPGMIIGHFVSIDHPQMPLKKGFIRAETIISGYIIRNVSERSCTVTVISQNDIKGLIPKMIVNKFAAKSPAEWVINLQKGCALTERIRKYNIIK